MKKNVFRILMSIAYCNCIIAIADDNVVYNPVDRTVFMPRVEITGDSLGQIFSVEMQQREGLNFEVSNVAQNETPPNSTIISKDYLHEFTTISGGSNYSVFVLCPKGMHATGGGYSINDDHSSVVASKPSPNEPSKWEVEFRLEGGGFSPESIITYEGIVYVVCAKN